MLPLHTEFQQADLELILATSLPAPAALAWLAERLSSAVKRRAVRCGYLVQYSTVQCNTVPV